MSVLTRERHPLRFDRYLLNQILDSWELTPIRITMVYVTIAVFGLYISDVFLVQRYSEPLLSQLQALKGGLEVIITGLLIFALTKTKEVQANRLSSRLERQNEELFVLHRVLRHNLRNKINVILGVSSFFSGEDRDELDKNRAEMLRNSAENVLHITEQASRINRVSSNGTRTTRVNLMDEVNGVAEKFRSEESAHQISVDGPDSATVRVNGLFRDAIEELVDNAITHNDHDAPKVEISVDPESGPIHQVEVSVSDNGPGIKDEIVSILKEGEVGQLSHLEGLGLWFVYWVVAESDGYLVIDDNEWGGATVSAHVPADRVMPTKSDLPVSLG